MLDNETVVTGEVNTASAELSLPETMQRFRGKFNVLEVEYEQMFRQLSSSLNRLGIDGLSARQREDVVLDSEYLIVRLRSRIMCEIASVQKVLSLELRPLLVDLLKSRLGVLTSYMVRLNELRSDCEVVQRTRYVDSFRKG